MNSISATDGAVIRSWCDRRVARDLAETLATNVARKESAGGGGCNIVQRRSTCLTPGRADGRLRRQLWHASRRPRSAPCPQHGRLRALPQAWHRTSPGLGRRGRPPGPNGHLLPLGRAPRPVILAPMVLAGVRSVALPPSLRSVALPHRDPPAAGPGLASKPAGMAVAAAHAPKPRGYTNTVMRVSKAMSPGNPSMVEGFRCQHVPRLPAPSKVVTQWHHHAGLFVRPRGGAQVPSKLLRERRSAQTAQAAGYPMSSSLARMTSGVMVASS